MAVKERIGKFGSYYGNDLNSSNPLTQAQMETNAMYIYAYLKNEGWSNNAIAGILGNMHVESSFNPGRWQNDDVGNSSGGYSLVQWTPASNYINWVAGDPSEMDNALSRIIYDLNQGNGFQWIPTSTYNFSFKDFSTSDLPPSTLARSFMLCYERPADQSEAAQSYRGGLADIWYTFITGLSPIKPTTKKKKKFKFILFKRRSIYGQR